MDFLSEDLRRMRTQPPPGCQAGPIDGNMRHWRALIKGPDDSPYEGYWYKFEIIFRDDYPLSPPRVVCNSWILHPNIASEQGGDVCISILTNWSQDSPRHIDDVFACIRALLINPSSQGGWNNLATRLLTQNRQNFIQEARRYVQRYASSSP